MDFNSPTIQHRSETLNIVVLSLAGLAITWCSYQSTLWGGIQTFKLARSNAAFRDAQERTLAIFEGEQVDDLIMVNFMNAMVANDTPKARMYKERVRAEMGNVLDLWMKMDPINNKTAPPHPGATNEYQAMVKAKFAEVDTMRKNGFDLWHDAEKANSNSDNYVLLTVVFSVVMFFCGVAPKVNNPKRALIMNIVSAAILTTMLVILATRMPYATRSM